jgi:hypothetical protein
MGLSDALADFFSTPMPVVRPMIEPGTVESAFEQSKPLPGGKREGSAPVMASRLSIEKILCDGFHAADSGKSAVCSGIIITSIE